MSGRGWQGHPVLPTHADIIKPNLPTHKRSPLSTLPKSWKVLNIFMDEHFTTSHGPGCDHSHSESSFSWSDEFSGILVCGHWYCPVKEHHWEEAVCLSRSLQPFIHIIKNPPPMQNSSLLSLSFYARCFDAFIIFPLLEWKPTATPHPPSLSWLKSQHTYTAQQTWQKFHHVSVTVKECSCMWTSELLLVLNVHTNVLACWVLREGVRDFSRGISLFVCLHLA